MSSIVAAVVADVNHDGWPDLVAANNGGPGGQNLSVFLNNHTNGFSARADYLAGGFTVGVAVGDLNGDGWPDLIGANNGDDSLSLLTNNGAGAFSAWQTIGLANSPFYVTTANLVASNRADIIVFGGAVFNGEITVLTNSGLGTFALATTLSVGLHPVVGLASDVNQDGRPDVLGVYNSGNTTYTNGYVGIGTTTPAQALEVNGNAQVDGNLISSNGISSPKWAITKIIDVALGNNVPSSFSTNFTTHGGTVLITVYVPVAEAAAVYGTSTLTLLVDGVVQETLNDADGRHGPCGPALHELYSPVTLAAFAQPRALRRSDQLVAVCRVH